MRKKMQKQPIDHLTVHALATVWLVGPAGCIGLKGRKVRQNLSLDLPEVS